MKNKIKPLDESIADELRENEKEHLDELIKLYIKHAFLSAAETFFSKPGQKRQNIKK
jgi:hypothetical protein